MDLTEDKDESGAPVSFGIGTSSHLAVIDLNAVATELDAWEPVPAQFLGAECDRLRFDSGSLEGSHVNSRAPWTSDDVWAKRVDHPTDPTKRAWVVQTENPFTGVQNDLASCINSDRGPNNRLDGTFHVPFSVSIVEQ